MDSFIAAVNRNELLDIIRADSDLMALVRSVGTADAGLLLEHRAGDNMTPSNYWKAVVEEIRKLLCQPSAPEYKELRAKAEKAGKAAEFLGLPMIAASIASYVNLPVGLISPFVALGLYTALQVGVASWCGTDQPQNVSIPE